MKPRVLTLCSMLLIGACSGDAPLLYTPLPNGYSFESNGGSYGIVRKPNGERFSEHFGIQPDGTERWCNEFGWVKSILVCRLANEAEEPIRELGYFILDTRSGIVRVAEDRERAASVLEELSVGSFPELLTRYSTTERK